MLFGRKKKSNVSQFKIDNQPVTDTKTNYEKRVERLKKEKRRIRNRKIIIRLIIIIILIVIGIVIYYNADKLTNPGNFLGGGSSRSSFDQKITGNSVEAMMEYRGNLSVLSNTSFTVYNTKGDILENRVHGIVNPAMNVSGEYVIIYNRGGRDLKIESGQTSMFSKIIDQHIINADVDKKGNFLIVTAGEGKNLSEIKFYDKAGKEQNKYEQSKYYITSVQYSPDGKNAVAVLVNSKDGAISSAIAIFDIDKNEPKIIPVEEDFLLKAKFSGTKIIAISDTALYSFTYDGEMTEKFDFTGYQLCAFNIYENSQCIVGLKKNTDKKDNKILLFDSDLNKLADVNSEEEMREVYVSENRIIGLSNTGLKIFNLQGEITEEHKTGEDAIKFTVINDSAYVVGLEELKKYDIKSKKIIIEK